MEDLIFVDFYNTYSKNEINSFPSNTVVINVLELSKNLINSSFNVTIACNIDEPFETDNIKFVNYLSLKEEIIDKNIIIFVNDHNNDRDTVMINGNKQVIILWVIDKWPDSHVVENVHWIWFNNVKNIRFLKNIDVSIFDNCIDSRLFNNDIVLKNKNHILINNIKNEDSDIKLVKDLSKVYKVHCNLTNSDSEIKNKLQNTKNLKKITFSNHYNHTNFLKECLISVWLNNPDSSEMISDVEKQSLFGSLIVAHSEENIKKEFIFENTHEKTSSSYLIAIDNINSLVNSNFNEYRNLMNIQEERCMYFYSGKQFCHKFINQYNILKDKRKNINITNIHEKLTEMFKKNEFENGIQKLNEVIDSNPNMNKDLMMNLLFLGANYYNKLNNNEKMLEYYNLAYNVSPTNIDLLNSIANNLQSIKNIKCLDYYKASLDLNFSYDIAEKFCWVLNEHSISMIKPHLIYYYISCLFIIKLINKDNSVLENKLNSLYTMMANDEMSHQYYKNANISGFYLDWNMKAFHQNYCLDRLYFGENVKPDFFSNRENEIIEKYNINEKIKNYKINSCKKKLNIGYISIDFKTHPVGKIIYSIIKGDTQETNQFFFDMSSNVKDDLKENLKNLVPSDRWIPMDIDKPLCDLSKIIEDKKIDILIDMMGMTNSSYSDLYCYKPAPIIISYFAYPGPSVYKSVDYKLVDKYLLPKNLEIYDEKMCIIDGCFQCYSYYNDKIIDTSKNTALVPENIRFGSFNNTHKVTEEVIETWSKILLAVPNSTFEMKYLFLQSDIVRERLYFQFKKNGIERDRVILGWEGEDIYKYYKNIDIALDPFPYQGGVTTSEVFYSNTPCVILEGNDVQSRVGISLANNIGHPELIAKTKEEYINLAINLTKSDRSVYNDLQEKMKNNSMANHDIFMKNLNKMYYNIWDDYVM